MMVRSRSFTGASLAGLLVLAACSDDPTVPAPDGGGGKGGAGTSSSSSASTGGAGTGGTPLPTGLTAKITSTRFLTADHMLASLEMQISGEPFAELLGRDLGGFDRFSTKTDNYTDPTTGVAGVDALGF